MSQNRVDFANTLRGFAALSVVLSHYFGVFWVYRQVTASLIYAPELSVAAYPTPAYVELLNYGLPTFSWGPYGVALFFIISGFVIPFSLRKMDMTGFLVSRFFRLVPVYVAGFSITLFFLWIGAQYFLREWPFTLREVLIHYIPGIRDLMNSRGIDGIVWTLEIEMKFYILCAIFIAWFQRYSLKVFFIPLALFIIALALDWKVGGWLANHMPALYQLSIVFVRVSQYIIFMFTGVVFHYLYQSQVTAKKACLLVAGLFAMFCLHWRAGPDSTSAYLSWNYAAAILTFLVAYKYPRFFRSNRIFNFLADISYPMYVIHGVAGYVGLRILLDCSWQPWQALTLVMSVCFAISWIVHRYVEIPSQKFGKKLAGIKINVPDSACNAPMDA